MSKHNIISDLDEHTIPEAPSELASMIALNSAIKAARAAEADKQYIDAALEVKSFIEFELNLDLD